jgi:nucleotide-binding universal stress UspA family protein
MGHEGSYHSELENKIEEERRLKILHDGVQQLNSAGFEAAGKLLKGDAVDQIVEYAHAIDADLIMLGHQHRDNWLERWWAGSIPKALIEHSPCSVLVVIIK